MEVNQKKFSIIKSSLVVTVLALVGGIGYYNYDKNQNKKTDSSVASEMNEQISKPEEEPADKAPSNTGWKTYISSSQKVSFEYPEDWFVTEESETNRIYINNYQGSVNKEDIPDNFQQLWLSTWDQEATAENESSVKSGNPKGREAGPVKAGTIKASTVTINTYEYQTAGGPTLQAFWVVNGKLFYATNSTEIGDQQQTEMVNNLKRLLSTIKHL